MKEKKTRRFVVRNILTFRFDVKPEEVVLWDDLEISSIELRFDCIIKDKHTGKELFYDMEPNTFVHEFIQDSTGKTHAQWELSKYCKPVADADSETGYRIEKLVDDPDIEVTLAPCDDGCTVYFLNSDDDNANAVRDFCITHRDIAEILREYADVFECELSRM